MARKKTNNFLNVFKIFFSSIHTFFLYFDQTSKALIFPIFGQLLSVIIIFTITYFYNIKGGEIQQNIPFLSNDKNLFITFMVLLIPFFIIFIKSFYSYIIKFASLNLLFYTHSNKKKVKTIDFTANDNVVQRKLFNYILLCLLVSILCIPPFILILPFLCLAFQVFVLEGDVSPFRAVTRSIEMVKSNIIPTFLLLVLCIITTYMFLPSLFIWAAQKSPIYSFMFNSCENFIVSTPLQDLINQVDLGILNEQINELLAPVSIARTMTDGIINFIILGFTLPFRCCCFTELYRTYDSEIIKENSKMTDEIVKRATSKNKG